MTREGLHSMWSLVQAVALVVGIGALIFFHNMGSSSNIATTSSDPAVPTATSSDPAVPTQWLNEVCEPAERSPADQYKIFAESGHAVLQDDRDVVKVTWQEERFTVVFYRTEAACRAAQRAAKQRVRDYENWLNKYR